MAERRRHGTRRAAREPAETIMPVAADGTREHHRDPAVRVGPDPRKRRRRAASGAAPASDVCSSVVR